jgi:hypothetical protein
MIAKPKESVPPEDGVHDQVTAVGDASAVLEAVRQAQLDTQQTAKVSAFDLADALRRTRTEEPERKQSGTRLIAQRPEETQYARAPADSVEIVIAPAVPIASVPPPPASVRKTTSLVPLVCLVLVVGLFIGAAIASAFLR